MSRIRLVARQRAACNKGAGTTPKVHRFVYSQMCTARVFTALARAFTALARAFTTFARADIGKNNHAFGETHVDRLVSARADGMDSGHSKVA
eukprot:6214750-Pleurochrysis_carterae.AAC.3